MSNSQFFLPVQAWANDGHGLVSGEQCFSAEVAGQFPQSNQKHRCRFACWCCCWGSFFPCTLQNVLLLRLADSSEVLACHSLCRTKLSGNCTEKIEIQSGVGNGNVCWMLVFVWHFTFTLCHVKSKWSHSWFWFSGKWPKMSFGDTLVN